MLLRFVWMFGLIGSFAFSAENVAAPIEVEKSILITEPSLLDTINQTYDFGLLLGRLGRWSQNQLPREERLTPGEYVRIPFNRAANEQRQHAAAPKSKRLGGVPLDDRYLDRVLEKWLPIVIGNASADNVSVNSFKDVKSPKYLREGPFRMLAVANLLDQAGDIDDRGNSEAARNARSLGELHLVYGFVDEDYEEFYGKAFPQTFVLSFVVPPLEKHSSGSFVRSQSITHHQLMQKDKESRRLWRSQMKVWGQLWADLSRKELHSSDYREALKRILNLVVVPETFLNLRSNTKINHSEFELREWYTLQRTQFLNPRRPRSEPHPCLSGSDELSTIVQYYWKQDYQDLDVTTYVGPTRPGFRTKGRNGFTVFRDNDPYNAKFGTDLDAFSTCPKKRGRMPFEMAGTRQETNGLDNTRLLAPFGRIKGRGPLWQLAPGVSEQKRHALAIRTCTGCHSQEGAAAGFHISPRLKGEPSRLSAFLTGELDRNTFRHDGVTYQYNILETRRKWIGSILAGKAKLGDSLMRPETR